MSPNVSVSIITYNEEHCLERCLKSVAWSDDIVILDSFSVDKTCEVAKSFEAVRFYQREFRDFSDQRNHAIHEIGYRNDWVFILDADEVCSVALAEELQSVPLDANSSAAVYNVMRRTSYKGRVLRHNTMGQAWIGRLVRPKQVVFEGAVHEKLQIRGSQAYLVAEVIHYPFAKGIPHWLERRFAYAARSHDSHAPLRLGDVFDRDPISRRNAQKNLLQRLPGKWLLYLAYSFVVTACYLDGRRGIEYTLLEAFSQFIVQAERTEDSLE